MRESQVSVIIPVYNEAATVEACLITLNDQTMPLKEIIVIDDGSTDATFDVIGRIAQGISSITLVRQKHQGPAKARNLGASQATGEILIFVDADMTFDRHFLQKLAAPILESNGTIKGTWTKEEFVANWDNIWARMWNVNEGWPPRKRIPQQASDEGTDFRSILKSEFDLVSGFDDTGYTDVYSLSRKLGYRPQAAPGAICYHQNPATLWEVWQQARWIGKNEFITGSLLRQLWSLWRYGFINSFLTALRITLTKQQPFFMPFKLVYDLAVWVSVAKSFFGEQKAK